MNVVVLTFLFFLLLFVVIGALSSLHKKDTPHDYLLADRNVSPWLAALSAVATNNSGFMFIGLIGYSYRLGIESIWMMLGWILGDFTAWFFVHKRVRHYSELVNVSTLSGLLGTRREKESRPIILAAGLITFILLGVYAAAQLKAGSTALHSLFGWDLRVGAVIGAVIVLVYCFSGGIRASIWTDAAQSFVMIAAMGVLLFMAVTEIGGLSALWSNLKSQDPNLIHWIPQNLEFGFAFYFLGMIFGGFGAIGQPQIMVRFMALKSVKSIDEARIYYFLWFVPFFLACIFVGLYARAIIPDLTALAGAQGIAEPTELAMPLLAKAILPDVFVGLTLAGLFAATMSTADSQILICSGAITQDINPKWKDSYLASKMGTLLVTVLALIIALYAGEGVFSLVLIAWSALGAGLGSVLIVRIFRAPLSDSTALGMMMAGILTVIIWNSSGFDDDVFKMLPGMAASFFVYLSAYFFRLFFPARKSKAENF